MNWGHARATPGYFTYTFTPGIYILALHANSRPLQLWSHYYIAFFRFNTSFNKRITRNFLREVRNDMPTIKEEEVIGMVCLLLCHGV